MAVRQTYRRQMFVCTQMLLILLLLPSVGAIIDCKSACGLCRMDKDPATVYITCTLCRKCHWALNPRRMMELQTPDRGKILVKGQVLSNNQLNALKKAELQVFKDVMDDYGWRPEDLTLKNTFNDEDEDCLPEPKDCLVEWDTKELLQTLKGKKTNCHKVHKTTCRPATKTTRQCPPIKTCKKKHTHQTTDPIADLTAYQTTDETAPIEDIQQTTTSMANDSASLRKLRKRILRQLASLDEAKPQDDGCPPQPDCSEEESDENYYDKLVNKQTSFTPPPLSTSTASTVEIQPCVPCTPLCPLPCRPQIPMPFAMPWPLPAPIGLPAMSLPALQPSQIPIEIMKALMTLKVPTKDVATTTEKGEVKEEEKEKLKSEEEKENGKEKMKRKEKNKEKRKEKVTVPDSSAESSKELVIQEIQEDTTTTEDYLYLYVGVPKDIKTVRRG